MEIKVKRLSDTAVVPKYATEGAACFDLHADLQSVGSVLAKVTPGLPSNIPTGLTFEVPEGHVMLVFSRSGHGFKNNVRLGNCVGVIDSDYRGEVMVRLTSDDDYLNRMFEVHHGDRVAQAMILPLPKVQFVEADELTDTERGDGGFGSTGSKYYGDDYEQERRLFDRAEARAINRDEKVKL